MLVKLLVLIIVAALCDHVGCQEYFLIYSPGRNAIAVYQDGNPNVVDILTIGQGESAYPLYMDDSPAVPVLYFVVAADGEPWEIKKKSLGSLVAPQTVAVGTPFFFGYAVHQGYLYYALLSGIFRLPLSNTLAPPEQMHSGKNRPARFDFFNQTMYNYYGEDITACDIENCEATTRPVASGRILIGGCGQVGNIGVDEINRRVYWSYGNCSQMATYYVNIDDESLGAQLFVCGLLPFKMEFNGTYFYHESGDAMAKYDLNGNFVEKVTVNQGLNSYFVHCPSCGDYGFVFEPAGDVPASTEPPPPPGKPCPGEDPSESTESEASITMAPTEPSTALESTDSETESQLTASSQELPTDDGDVSSSSSLSATIFNIMIGVVVVFFH